MSKFLLTDNYHSNKIIINNKPDVNFENALKTIGSQIEINKLSVVASFYSKLLMIF